MTPDASSREPIAEALGDELLEIHFESYGAGAKSATVEVSEEAVVVFLDDLELLPNERFLVDHGQHEIVLRVRSQYQATIQASFVAAVERATGRKVTHFFSETVLADPPFCAEIFRLAPVEQAA